VEFAPLTEVTDLLAEVDAAKLARVEVNAAHLFNSGHLREGITLEAARDVL
jgi:hypothetical protein